MQRILIIGNNGSGKSTFARRLGEKLKIPVIHLDSHYHLPGGKTLAKNDWDKLQYELTKGETWIIDGTYLRTLKIRIEAADTIIFLDVPKWLAFARAVNRRISYHNKSRPDRPIFLPEKLSLRLIKKITFFSKDNMLHLVGQAGKKKQLIHLCGTKDIEKFLHDL